MTSATRRQHSLMFRGASFMALGLKPEMPTDRWLAELDQCLSRSPEFFEGKPVVIDVSGLSLTKRKFVALAAELKARGIRILGMQGADAGPVQRRRAVAIDLATVLPRVQGSAAARARVH